ncbi:hypothetical protein SAMN04488012_107101 [Palleronia salina]|uniref:N-(5'-phosphoribosyl)anthranilate isomerase n=1 Tax=Palleronia salina TaxID=313368 RepID=A0A1M6IAZ9_9RHOB|nr:N-(5'-phosphoribosyl)anthranilate isomerase [Palleronia salina]SHJ31614.1 hypothetical protein SAMN04488012_107101 [Palleronia salina]
MQERYETITPDQFLFQIFRSKSAMAGGVVRRAARDVERVMGRAAFRAELERRGFHAVENAGQFVIFCNNEPVRVVC